MSNLIVSMARFSTAMTLFGVEQMENSFSVATGGKELSKTVEEFEKTLNALTDVLMKEMDEKKKETVESVSKISEDMVGPTLDGLKVMDPREMLRAGNDLLQKTADVTSKWVSKAASAMEKAAESVRPTEEAQPAAAAK